MTHANRLAAYLFIMATILLLYDESGVAMPAKPPIVENYAMSMFGNSVFWTEEHLYILHDYSNTIGWDSFPQAHSLSRVDRDSGEITLLIPLWIADTIDMCGNDNMLYFLSNYCFSDSNHSKGKYFSRMDLHTSKLEEISDDLNVADHICDFACIDDSVYCLGNQAIYRLDTKTCDFSRVFDVSDSVLQDIKDTDRYIQNKIHSCHIVFDNGSLYFQVGDRLFRLDLSTNRAYTVCSIPFYFFNEYYCDHSPWYALNSLMYNHYQYMIVDHMPFYYSPVKQRMVKYSFEEGELPYNLDGEFYPCQVSEDGLLLKRAVPITEYQGYPETGKNETLYISWKDKGWDRSNKTSFQLHPMPSQSILIGYGNYIIANELNLFEGNDNEEYCVNIYKLPY